MKKLVFIACALSSASFATPSTVPTQQTGSTIAIKQGQTTFNINLTSNPTTGFRWYLGKCSHGIKALSAHYKPYKGTLVGAPGSVVWTFQLTNQQDQVPRVRQCDLIYMRGWDHRSAMKKTFWIVTGS